MTFQSSVVIIKEKDVFLVQLYNTITLILVFHSLQWKIRIFIIYIYYYSKF